MADEPHTLLHHFVYQGQSFMGLSEAGRARLAAAAPLLKAALEGAIADATAESPLAVIHAARIEAGGEPVMCTGTAKHNVRCGFEVCSSARPCRTHTAHLLAVLECSVQQRRKRQRAASDDDDDEEEAEYRLGDKAEGEEEEEAQEPGDEDWEAAAAGGFRWRRKGEAHKWLAEHVTASNFESQSAREVREQFAEEHGLSYSGHALKLFKRAWQALIDERVAVVRAEIGDEDDEELSDGGDTAETGEVEGATPRYAHASQPADVPVD